LYLFIISGVTERGIYVEILENKCEGFIKINEIKGDFFTFDEGKHRLIGEKSKVIYQLGAVLEIVVKKADIIKVYSKVSENSSFEILEQKFIEEDISLNDADVVISAGRGLKGPENWQMIEDLAKKLNAATACSKPVSDAGWRPHHEHVGQTGLKISPKIYFAIGISGAIQHLAGVNSSKTIIVINNDPEAPFFKAADYGIVGDAFEVVPKIINSLD